MRPLALTLILAVTAAGAGGCGLRGPLYLPNDPSRGQSEAARPAEEEGDAKVTTPQPAPQAQKRDRTTSRPSDNTPPAN